MMASLAMPRIRLDPMRIRHALSMRPLREVFEQRRWILTESTEPPPTSLIPERPCTVVLTEDRSLYENDSWHTKFRQSLPYERGLQYCHLEMKNVRSLDECLAMLEQDLRMLMNVVLVARGPVSSWMAQYYLESLPLAGLVMGDPVLLSDDYSDVLEKLENLYKPDSDERHLLKRIMSGTETRPLHLEPGSVPMVVLQSLHDPLLSNTILKTAQRHRNTQRLHGDVPVHSLSSDYASTQAIDIICNWIDNSVL